MPKDLSHPPSTVHPSQLHTPLPPGHTYGDPIPTCTTRTPGELLAAYYIDRPLPEWTDPKDLVKKKLEAWRNHPYNVSGSTGPPGSVARPHGLAAEPVPARWDLVYPALNIEFRNLNGKCPSAGVPLGDFYVSNWNALADAGDIVFCGNKGVDMDLLISWPGYQAHYCTIHTTAADGGHPSRFELGHKIAKAYAGYFQNVEEQQLLSNQVDFYNISHDQGSGSRSDSSGVQLLQLHLVRVSGRIGGTWIAEVDIV